MINDVSYQPSRQNIKKDYQIKRFVNPYLEKKTKKFNTKLYLQVILAVFLIYVVFYSDLFKIKNINITGLDIISEGEIKPLIQQKLSGWRYLIMPADNMLFMDKDGITRDINAKFRLKQLTVKKSWRALNINLQEDVSYVIIFNNQKFYFADGDGIIQREIADNQKNNYTDRFPILNVSQPQINIGDHIISKKIIGYVLDLDKQLKTVGIYPKGYESEGTDQVNMVSKDGWKAYFDTGSDIMASIDNLQLILKEKVPDKNKLNYIDLRFGNKVFMK